MNNIDYQDYEIYHDESICNGYWHGILFVPVSIKDLLLSYLTQSRKNLKFYSKIRFSEIHRYGPKYLLAKSWLSIGACFLRSITKEIPYPIYLGQKLGRSFCYDCAADKCLGLKFILFRDRDEFSNMLFYKDSLSKVETSFRIGLKGGLHYLFSEDNAIKVVKLHFDGHEHHKRHIDRERVIGRIYGLRDYCVISNNDDLIDDGSSNYGYPKAQNNGDCQLLQLTDLLIGAFRHALGFHVSVENRFQLDLSNIVRPLIQKYSKGLARMKNSRWFHSYCLSQSYIENDSWHFETVDELIKVKEQQLPLFD